MIEQAELNRAFFARYGEPSRAFFPKSLSQNRAELRLGPNTNKYIYFLYYVIYSIVILVIHWLIMTLLQKKLLNSVVEKWTWWFLELELVELFAVKML